MEFVSTFLIGFLGSFHCIGMCGPIVLALPSSDSKTSLIVSRLIYNFGRIVTYAFLGGILGVLGGKIILSGYQEILSIFLGVVLIAFAVFPYLLDKVFSKGIIEPLISPLKNFVSTFLASKSKVAFFLIGILNGYLPCGLVYAGLVKSVHSGTLVYGSLHMLAFGLGTLPLMFAWGILSNFLTLKARRIGNYIAQFWLIVLGVIFILRGLSLGIPYISPILDSVLGVPQCCH